MAGQGGQILACNKRKKILWSRGPILPRLDREAISCGSPGQPDKAAAGEAKSDHIVCIKKNSVATVWLARVADKAATGEAKSGRIVCKKKKFCGHGVVGHGG